MGIDSYRVGETDGRLLVGQIACFFASFFSKTEDWGVQLLITINLINL